MVVFEVADKIPHPAPAVFFCVSIPIGVGLASSARITRRRWPCLVAAGAWFACTGVWSAMFCAGGPPWEAINAAFGEEVGTAYFPDASIAALAPAVLVVAFGRARLDPSGVSK